MKNLSEKSLEVWGLLDDQERRAIRKDNPFRADRNEAIKALRRRGVGMDIIAEIAGFHIGHIKRLAGKIKPVAWEFNHKKIESKINRIEIVIADLLKELSEIKTNILTNIKDN
ncbi:hypothetical protein [Desulfobacula sp.]|uniref:hypothetical protein n=1 Tax=Desulfobacula sp. TaxID=2593537 RepID=UPI0025B9BDDF|nr:hypothetical protein [Desulfobacula sp.]MBC2703983.1 hypothetical protein [Desulfobacula sp.]